MPTVRADNVTNIPPLFVPLINPYTVPHQHSFITANRTAYEHPKRCPNTGTEQ